MIDILNATTNTVLVDIEGRVIRSPETEAEIAALKARIAELEQQVKPEPPTDMVERLAHVARDARLAGPPPGSDVPLARWAIHTELLGIRAVLRELIAMGEDDRWPPQLYVMDHDLDAGEENPQQWLKLQDVDPIVAALRAENAEVKEQLRRETEEWLAMRAERDKIYAIWQQSYVDDRNARVRDFFYFVAPNQERLDKPGIPSEETLRLRFKLIGEEFCELARDLFIDWSTTALVEACQQLGEHTPLREDLVSRLPGIIDALADIAYVNEGFAIACGVDLNGVFRVVHEANMRKKNGPIVAGKRMKPAGWQAPDIVGELERQGWKR